MTASSSPNTHPAVAHGPRPTFDNPEVRAAAVAEVWPQLHAWALSRYEDDKVLVLQQVADAVARTTVMHGAVAYADTYAIAAHLASRFYWSPDRYLITVLDKINMGAALHAAVEAWAAEGRANGVVPAFKPGDRVFLTKYRTGQKGTVAVVVPGQALYAVALDGHTHDVPDVLLVGFEHVVPVNGEDPVDTATLGCADEFDRLLTRGYIDPVAAGMDFFQFDSVLKIDKQAVARKAYKDGVIVGAGVEGSKAILIFSAGTDPETVAVLRKQLEGDAAVMFSVLHWLEQDHDTTEDREDEKNAPARRWDDGLKAFVPT